MSDQYYLRSRGKVLGPFPLERLQVMKSRGQLGRTHQISTDRQTWVAAGTLNELFAAAPAKQAADQIDLEPVDEFQAAPVSGATGSGPAAPVAAWFYHAGGQQYGPVPAMELRRLSGEGFLQPDDMVWREGMENWLPLKDVPELAVAKQATPQSGNPTRRRRSAAAVTALCLGIAPWPLYGIGILAFAIATSSIKEQSVSGADLLSLVLGAGFFSLVLNFAWFILSVLAIIFGGIGLSAISQSEGRLLGQGMAVTGLVVGIVNLIALFLWIPLAMMMKGG